MHGSRPARYLTVAAACMLLLACHRRRQAPPPPVADYMVVEPSPVEACVSQFLEGSRQYERFKVVSDPLDVAHFQMAADYLQRAEVSCYGWEYEDDALYTLGLSELFLGNYGAALRHLNTLLSRYPSSDFSANTTVPTVTRVLAACSADASMDTYRRAALYELFAWRVPNTVDRPAASAALSLYREVATSSCTPLATYGVAQVRRLSASLGVAPN